jgi:hypothetical protein
MTTDFFKEMDVQEEDHIKYEGLSWVLVPEY